MYLARQILEHTRKKRFGFFCCFVLQTRVGIYLFRNQLSKIITFMFSVGANCVIYVSKCVLLLEDFFNSPNQWFVSVLFCEWEFNNSFFYNLHSESQCSSHVFSISGRNLYFFVCEDSCSCRRYFKNRIEWKICICMSFAEPQTYD